MLDELAISYAAYAVTNGSPTPGTYGRKCGGLFETDALDISLGNRLQEKMEEFGSRLFVLRWKYWDMPLGRRVLAQQVSGRRTSGSDCTSWPSPTSSNADYGCQYKTMEWKLQSGKRPSGAQIGAQLSVTALMAAWATPNAMDFLPNGNLDNRKTKGGCVNLKDQAPLTASGETQNGSGAATGSGGQLNPRHSAWLMGLPIVWDECALRVEKKSSSRSSRKAKTESEG
jgi:hypothetical protein